MNTDQVVRDAYFEEAEADRLQGLRRRDRRPDVRARGRRSRARRGPRSAQYVLYEAQTYASYQTPGQHSTPGVRAETVDDLKASPQFVVGTPEPRCGPAWNRFPPDGSVTFNPLAGGLPPELAWASLELFAAAGPAPPAFASSLASDPASELTCSRVHSLVPTGGTVESIPPEEVGNGPIPPFRHCPRRRSTGDGRPSAIDAACRGVRSRRAGFESAMSELERALAAPAPDRVDEWRRGRARGARLRCTTCGRATSSRPRRPARSSTSWSVRRRACRRPRRSLRREHNEILGVINRAEKALDQVLLDDDHDVWVDTCRADLTDDALRARAPPPARRRPHLRRLRRRHRRRMSD